MTKTAKKVRKNAALPKGYVLARQRLDGFFAFTEGNSVQGILRGSFEVRGKFGAKRVYRIEIVEGETTVNDGELVGPGRVIGLDETGYSKVLSDLEPGVGVFVRYEGRDGEGEKAAKILTVGRAE